VPYIDTSVIVKLYSLEEYSLEVSKWIRKNNEAIPLTNLHELEFTNAIYLKQFRREISPEQANLILSRFDEHQREGIYYHPKLNWVDIWNKSLELSGKHTGIKGSRSLDILHVASALELKFSRFVTLDSRQADLARKAGLKLIRII
jgi:predicted nucleic acid-binding protein